MTHLRLWRFDVPAATEERFVEAYCADGDWARLFGPFHRDDLDLPLGIQLMGQPEGEGALRRYAHAVTAGERVAPPASAGRRPRRS